MKETEISTLGEFGLIDQLTKNFTVKNESTLHGVGDDCAVLDYGGDKLTLVTTDLLLEGIHFDLRYVPLKHLGYKAVVVNLSDIYAMNGTPKQITVSLGISKRFTVEHIAELYEGIQAACEHYNVDLVGGDTSASVTGLLISVTAMGEGKKDEVVMRSGAHDTDLVCVSGDLGAAYMGLQLLERERKVAEELHDEHFQPDFSGREYLLERQLKPEARRDVIAEMKSLGISPTAMMDVSDGLSSELLHICKASGVGCRVYEDRIPIDYQTAITAEEMNMNLVTAAMNGGEDYELLFTVPLAQLGLVEQMKTARLIGRITQPELGVRLVTRDDSELEIRAQGWNAFSE
ncbi:MAG: thiamine-phosphate kinase [Muribaculaceae bacterium]|nr:thiamine-phosphate kinase [Muribaculaceae bacterium]